jgi:hypothetical protein
MHVSSTNRPGLSGSGCMVAYLDTRFSSSVRVAGDSLKISGAGCTIAISAMGSAVWDASDNGLIGPRNPHLRIFANCENKITESLRLSGEHDLD